MSIVQTTEETLRSVLADSGRAAQLDSITEGAGGSVRLHPPAGAPRDCEAFEIEVLEGSDLNLTVRGQIIEVTAGDFERTPFEHDHQRGIFEIARAVVEGNASWHRLTDPKTSEVWKESVAFETADGPFEVGTDFGTRPALSARAREEVGRFHEYPRGEHIDT